MRNLACFFTRAFKAHKIKCAAMHPYSNAHGNCAFQSAFLRLKTNLSAEETSGA